MGSENDEALLEVYKESIAWNKNLYKEMQGIRELFQSLVTLTDSGVHVAFEDQPIYVTVPDGGSTYAIPAGETYIDFREGTINRSDGVQEHMRINLRSHNQKFMRSYLIIADQDVMVSLDGGGLWTLRANEGICEARPVTQIYIGATVPTNIRIRATTSPQMTMFYDRTFSPDNPLEPPTEPATTGPVTSAVAQSVELDLGEYGRSLVEVFGSSTVATNFYYDTSPDKVNWFNEETWSNVTEAHDGYDNVARYQRMRSDPIPGGTVTLTVIGGR